jgi:NAD-dependent SIR2 family protein deacetylase
LLEAVWTRARKLDPNPLQDLEQRCRAAGITNVEEVLTALWMANVSTSHPNLPLLFEGLLFPSRNPVLPGAAREPSAIAHSLETFNTLFSILTGTMLAARPNTIHETICSGIKSGVVSSVITTNYDACLELALEEANVGFDSIVKVHGSVNWFYCGDCQLLSKVAIKKVLASIANRIPYPLMGMCPDCSGKMQQFIIPPTALKWVRFPPSIDVWSQARDALDEAQLIVVVGYSFGDADDYLVRTLVRAIGQDETKRIMIIDPSLAVAMQATRLLYRHLKVVAPGRVSLIGGLGEVAVPLLVSSVLAQNDR